jgi:hypothetical protein
MIQMDKRLLVAGAACTLAAFFFGASLLDALDAGAAVTPPVPARAATATDAKAAPEVISMNAVNEAVAVDPFSPDRRPSDTPYKLPTDPAPAPPPPPPPAPPSIPGFKLVGTTQTTTGSIALIQVDNSTPKVVAVGDALSGFVVQRIERTSATLAQGDRRVDLTLQQPSLRGESNGRRGVQTQPGRGGPGGRGGQNDPAVQKQMLQEMQQLMQQQQQQRVRRDTTFSPRSPRSER